MNDMIDLAPLHILNSPDVKAWPITVGITSLVMDPAGGLTLTFDRVLPDAWKFGTDPAKPTDNIQFTVWASVHNTYLAGFVEMWQGRAMGDRSLPPILSGYPDWWGDPRKLWGAMSDYVPQPGDTIGLMVTAGNARLRTDVTSIAERSQLVVVTLPADDRGVFTFGAAPVPVPPPPPTPADDSIEHLIELAGAAVDAITANTQAVLRLSDTIVAVQKSGFRVHW